MESIFSFFPDLPWTWTMIFFHVISALGAIMMIYAIFLEAEKRQDAVMAIGALCLMFYALWLQNMIFTIAMGGVALASLVELVEILTGRHTHSEELVEKYRKP